MPIHKVRSNEQRNNEGTLLHETEEQDDLSKERILWTVGEWARKDSCFFHAYGGECCVETSVVEGCDRSARRKCREIVSIDLSRDYFRYLGNLAVYDGSVELTTAWPA